MSTQNISIINDNAIIFKNKSYQCRGKTNTIPSDFTEAHFISETEHIDFELVYTTPAKISVINATTFEAARSLAVSNSVTVLNFASAWSPGGGYLKGCTAQEECLCRESTLYASLSSPEAKPFYDYQHKHQVPLNTANMIFSPNVYVIRNKQGILLSSPFAVSTITCAAVDHRRLDPSIPEAAIREAMTARVRNILALAARENPDTIILGAWGCGVFGNSPDVVSEIFRSVIDEYEFRYAFKHIVFAIPQTVKTNRNYLAFKERFCTA